MYTHFRVGDHVISAMSSVYDQKGVVVETTGEKFYITWNKALGANPLRQGPFYQNEMSICRAGDVNRTDYNKGDSVIWTYAGVMGFTGIILNVGMTFVAVRWKREGYFSDYMHPKNESRIVKMCGEEL